MYQGIDLLSLLLLLYQNYYKQSQFPFESLYQSFQLVLYSHLNNYLLQRKQYKEQHHQVHLNLQQHNHNLLVLSSKALGSNKATKSPVPPIKALLIAEKCYRCININIFLRVNSSISLKPIQESSQAYHLIGS